MTERQLKDRTKAFTLRVLKLEGACGGSRPDDRGQTRSAPAEADELTAIMVASRKTLLADDRKPRIENRE
jgi:hypothetical protein